MNSAKSSLKFFSVDPESFVPVSLIAGAFGTAGYLMTRQYLQRSQRGMGGITVISPAWEGSDTDDFKYKYTTADGKQKSQEILRKSIFYINKNTAENCHVGFTLAEPESSDSAQVGQKRRNVEEN